MVQVVGPPSGGRPPGGREKFNMGLQKSMEMLEQYRNMQQQKQAYEQLGLDPAIQHLPPEGRQAAFKQAFAPEKQMTPLQQTQQQLAQERLKALQSQQSRFDSLLGRNQNPQQQDMMPGQDQQQGQQQGQPGQFDIRNVPDEVLDQFAPFSGQPGEEGVIGNMAKSEKERRKEEKVLQRKEFGEERKYHSEFSKKAEEEANQLRTSIPKKEMALNFARNAVETGELGFFSPDKLADVTGIDLFRTAKGAQLITAGKENLLSNMSRVSAKAQNQWFEQRLNSMFPKIGQSKESNLTVQEMLEGETALDKSYLDEFDRLVAEDEQKYGFVKKDISKRTHAAIKPLENEILKRTTYRMKEVEESEKGLSGMKGQVGKNVPKGTPLTLSMAKLYKSKFGENALNVAEKNGYYIPTVEEFRIFQERPEEFREGFGQ